MYLFKSYDSFWNKNQLSKRAKLEWHNQDIKKLIQNTFNNASPFEDLNRTISKAQENELLMKLNKIVQEIAERESINATFFFSKKVQKDFIRLVFIKGLELALQEITSWRSDLLKEDIVELLK